MALLQHDFWPAMLRDDVGCGTITETHIDPSRSSQLAFCFLELEKLNQELKGKLRNDFINILNGIDSINISSTPQPPSPSPTPPSHVSSLHDTSFITEAYSWLLHNIANPYPSSTFKASLSHRYNCSLSAINSWFINARRRIGWTALCRNHFDSCRADALDAAHRALVKEDAKRQLPPDVVHAFISVKVAAEELYSSTLAKSALASDLDSVVKDMSDQESAPEHGQGCRESEGRIELSKGSEIGIQNRPSVAQNSYPSPQLSPSSFLEPALDESFTGESGNIADGLPPVRACRKRRLCSLESDTATSEPTTRLVKRPRFSSSANAYLPTPTPVTNGSLETDQIPWSVPITQSSTSSQTRKRRLSDPYAINMPKRPRDITDGPHLHTISDPLSLSTEGCENSIDEWFKADFDASFALPPLADVAELDLPTQWEVELFNNYNLPEAPQAVIPPIQDNQGSSSTDSIFDDLLQYLQTDSFVAPQERMDLSTIASVPDPASQALPLLPDLSQFIDWTALLSDSELTSDSIFPQSYINPALTDSLLQLPQVWTTVAS